jgi:Uma2 family endonuclease
VPIDRGRRGHTKPTDVLLIVEVSDSSLRYDRETKLRAYARNGIKEYWIVNLIDDVVEVFREPQDDAYLDINNFGLDATVSPAAFPDVVLNVSNLIPAR